MRDVQRAQLSRIDTDESPNRGLGVSFSRMIKASKGPFLGLNSDFETRRAKICQKYLAQNSGNDMEAQIRKLKWNCCWVLHGNLEEKNGQDLPEDVVQNVFKRLKAKIRSAKKVRKSMGRHGGG